VDVNANDVLGDVTSAVNEPIGDLLTDLQPVFDGLNEATGIDAQTLLNRIIEAITGGDLVRVTLGPSHSEAGATAATEFAQASAQGAVIEVLPRDLLELDPVLTIEVGAASNTITIDRATGLATVAYSPSIVTATLASDIATALGLSDAQRTVSVAPDQSQCLGLPAPLDSCITVAGGSQSTDDQGVTHANAAGVSLHLLTGVQDGIRLALAATSVEGVGALETSREAPPEEPPLARTGGTANTVLGAGLFAVAVGGMMLVRSTRRRYEIL
jgi:hypothetical protein